MKLWATATPLIANSTGAMDDLEEDSKEVDVSSSSSKHLYELAWAAMMDDVDLFRTVFSKLEKSACAKAVITSPEGVESILSVACYFGSTCMFNHLLTLDPLCIYSKPTSTPTSLSNAVSQGHLHFVQQLLALLSSQTTLVKPHIQKAFKAAIKSSNASPELLKIFLQPPISLDVTFEKLVCFRTLIESDNLPLLSLLVQHVDQSELKKSMDTFAKLIESSVATAISKPQTTSVLTYLLSTSLLPPSTVLFIAAGAGKMDLVRQLLHEHQFEDAELKEAYVRAASLQVLKTRISKPALHVEVMRELGSRASLEWRTEALRRAYGSGHLGAVGYLIGAGVEVEVLTSCLEGCEVHLQALKEGYVGVVELLLGRIEGKACKMGTVLSNAFQIGGNAGASVLNLLVSHGLVNVNSLFSSTRIQTLFNPFTITKDASTDSLQTLLQTFLIHPTNLPLTALNSWILPTSIKNGWTHIVKLLLTHTDLQTPSHESIQTSLAQACFNGHAELISALVAEPFKSKLGLTETLVCEMVEYACRGSQAGIVQVLVGEMREGGLDEALLVGVKVGSGGCVEVLVECGGKVGKEGLVEGLKVAASGGGGSGMLEVLVEAYRQL
ncbi:hypothetical protein HDV05_004106 [Chytridiales sp. JEL 0842]|nr:hypothetical protein HDV05_004106 [Chytridiales sp. JEL 0842]